MICEKLFLALAHGVCLNYRWLNFLSSALYLVCDEWCPQSVVRQCTVIAMIHYLTIVPRGIYQPETNF